MNNEANLPKTQAATLAEIRRINASDESAIRYGTQRKGIYLNAIDPLIAKGFLKTHTVVSFREDGQPIKATYVLDV